MMLFPKPRLTRFAQLQPGGLFLMFGERHRMYGLKTAPVDGDHLIVTLGPFQGEHPESHVTDDQHVPVLAYDKAFCVLLPTESSAWSLDGDVRTPPVYLALCEETIYVCTNASRSASGYTPCFVDISSGHALERLPSRAVFTNAWEIVIERQNGQAARLLLPVEN